MAAHAPRQLAIRALPDDETLLVDGQSACIADDPQDATGRESRPEPQQITAYGIQDVESRSPPKRAMRLPEARCESFAGRDVDYRAQAGPARDAPAEGRYKYAVLDHAEIVEMQAIRQGIGVAHITFTLSASICSTLQI